jgi:hypothetical protein
MGSRIVGLLTDHPLSGSLGEEKRSLEIGGNQFVEAVFLGFENVGPSARGNSSIVDEDIQPAKGFFDCAQKIAAIGCEGNIALHID